MKRLLTVEDTFEMSGREHVHPSPAANRWACLFAALGKADVPIGTEIWCAENVFMPSLRPAR